jgi:hypothetical protein
MPEAPVLVIVSVDPERSHRANEAVRIALGIVAGENQVVIALLGPAVKVLADEVEDYVDGEDLARHLLAFKRLGQPFLVQADALPAGPGWNGAGLRVAPVDAAGLAALVASSRRTLVF